MRWLHTLSQPTPRVRDRRDRLIAIVARYAGRITVRQAFYQLVVAGAPNTESTYRRCIDDLTWLRKAGEIALDAIEDRGRSISRPFIFDDPDEARAWLRRLYDEDRWNTQPRRVLVILEKAALSGIVQAVCRRWQVPFAAARGYTSTSLITEAARDYDGYLVLYFGDHDPSGLDMARDWTDRFAGWGAQVEVRVCALTAAQVAQYGLPPQRIKGEREEEGRQTRGDSRAPGYAAQHGDDVYELDALPPNVLEQIVESEITAEIDWVAWDARAAEIEVARGQL